jgi:hypothetical protein
MPTIHNHDIEGDQDGIHALKQLDNEEAQVLFEHAKRHNEAAFEGTIQGKRMNFKLVRESDGTHKVESEGKETSHTTGWF